MMTADATSIRGLISMLALSRMLTHRVTVLTLAVGFGCGLELSLSAADVAPAVPAIIRGTSLPTVPSSPSANVPEPGQQATGVPAGSQPSAISGGQNQPKTFQERLESLQEQAARSAWEEANRPTAWQLQNPAGEFNRSATDKEPNGVIAPNTYYGPQFREWNGMSAPVYERTLPPNMVPVPPLTQTNVMIAPNTYLGADNYRWHQVSPGSASMNPLGGWNLRAGW